jgi:Ca2+-binding EF-hand superfamily protein
MGIIWPLLWAMLLLLIIKYVFAVCLLQMIADDLGNLDRHSQEALLKDYGSIRIAAYTLYKAISGGVDWGDVASPLEEVYGGFPVVLLCIYVAFFVFCVLNVLTGIFVESANKLVQKDDDRMAMVHSTSRKIKLQKIIEIFQKMNDGGTVMGYDEFANALDDIRVQQYLEEAGLEVATCGKKELFTLLDADGSGYIDTNEFTVGVEHLQGAARSRDIYALKRRQQILHKSMQNMMGKFDAVIEHLGVNAGSTSSLANTTRALPHRATEIRERHSSHYDYSVD